MIHIAAVTQLRLPTDGRVYYRRKRAEGKKPMEAMRCLKRRISDAIYRQLVADAMATTPRVNAGPGGHCGASLVSSAAGFNPHTGTSDQPLPGPAIPTLPREHGPCEPPCRGRLPSPGADVPEPSRWSAPPDERP
jgi:transposase